MRHDSFEIHADRNDAKGNSRMPYDFLKVDVISPFMAGLALARQGQEQRHQMEQMQMQRAYQTLLEEEQARLTAHQLRQDAVAKQKAQLKMDEVLREQRWFDSLGPALEREQAAAVHRTKEAEQLPPYSLDEAGVPKPSMTAITPDWTPQRTAEWFAKRALTDPGAPLEIKRAAMTSVLSSEAAMQRALLASQSRETIADWADQTRVQIHNDRLDLDYDRLGALSTFTDARERHAARSQRIAVINTKLKNLRDLIRMEQAKPASQLNKSKIEEWEAQLAKDQTTLSELERQTGDESLPAGATSGTTPRGYRKIIYPAGKH